MSILLVCDKCTKNAIPQRFNYVDIIIGHSNIDTKCDKCGNNIRNNWTCAELIISGECADDRIAPLMTHFKLI